MAEAPAATVKPTASGRLRLAVPDKNRPVSRCITARAWAPFHTPSTITPAIGSAYTAQTAFVAGLGVA